MPTAVAALPTVPFPVTASVAACCTRPMQQACGDRPVKSAPLLNATLMPRPASRFPRLAEERRLTLGSTMSVSPPPVLGIANAPAMPLRVCADSAGQPPDPESGSSAVIASFPPRYGSDTAVHPPALTIRNAPPCRNSALTCRPVAVVNCPGLVWLAGNGADQSASRYRASVSTQAMPLRLSGPSSCGM